MCQSNWIGDENLVRQKAEPKDKEWKELCEYVKKEILQYDDEMKFPKYLALRLQGLKKGQLVANNEYEIQAQYDDHTILCTFKLCKQRIVDYLHDNATKIENERHKINLIMKIVEPEINDVYLRLKNVKRTQEQIQGESFNNQSYEGAEYKKKTKDVNEKLKKLF